MSHRMMLIFLLIFSQKLFAGEIDEFEIDFFEPKTSVGGYGELHYNQETKADASISKIIDFHRFVLFYSHSWTEKWSFKAEVELEHNFVNDGQGELELEQAFINYHHSQGFGFQTGVVLPSIGLLNEYHEPPLFLSVERPDYAKEIIPTTWFGNGVAIYGRSSSLDYKLTIMEGLDASKFSLSGGIRGGRLKGYKAPADELLYSLRVNYVGLPMLKAGASASYTKAMGDDDHIDIPLALIETHAQLNLGNLLAQGEYGNIQYTKGNLEQSSGYYFDLGCNIAAMAKVKAELIAWVRLSSYNTSAKTGIGGDEEKKYGYSKWMAGLTLKPINEISFKVDFGIKTNDLSKDEVKVFNLGAGYMF